MAIRLTPHLHKFMGFNPSDLTLDGTCTYLIGTGPERILIDTAQGIPEYHQILNTFLLEQGIRLKAIFLTHSHPDHIGGLAQILIDQGSISVYKKCITDQTESEIQQQTGTNFIDIDDGYEYQHENFTLKAVFTPGHCQDHLCYLLYPDNALFTGDLILGQGSTTMENYKDYMNSLQKLHGFSPALIYPGHGEPVLDALGKIEEYMEHRRSRERQIINIIQQQPFDIHEIVRQMYGDISEGLIPAAMQNANLYLARLLEDEVVKISSEGKYFVSKL